MIRKIFILLIFLAVFWGFGVSPVLGYSDGILIRADGYEEVYVLEDGLRRWIINPDVFNGLGYKWTNVRVISKEAVDNHALGNDLINSYYYPNGSLIKADAPEVYLIEAGKKRWIPNPQIFEAKGFGWERIIKVSDYTLRTISQGTDTILEQESLEPSTSIAEGPCRQWQNDIPTIDLMEVNFKFSGTNPSGPNKDLSFETYLQNYDERWQSNYSYERKIELGQGSGVYTFYVRAKNKAGYYDKSPAFCKFKTKISSYKDKITIYSTSGWNDNPEYEYVTIGASYSLSESINITGWAIKSNKGRFFIPQVVKVIHPESIYNIKKDIYLASNNRITIHGGQSEITENAFGINTCWWYVNDSEEYKDCYYEKNQEPNFLTGEYKFYLNRTSEMFDNQDETITLLDKDGLVVDTYSY